jgi:hypothetical protein
MPRYMMLITHSEDLRTQDIPQGLNEEMGEFVTENLKKGVLLDTNGLRPTAEATRVRQSRRKLSITDGPFTEAKEVVGGYALVDVGSKDEAVDLARRFMEIHLRHWPDFEGSCEVRAIDGGEPVPSASHASSEAAAS